ncbi:spore coat protein [Bifidobacterium hapali]|uniref:Spore coat protein n=1 Tax=Bifidobacterium hapali TaxID=1630172 RepID=A0A261G2U1_9BIFI|nr:hypothetical protein [Bifidobacterium hapali]OZG65316.1 spore coat protein [Bifidobacterium hapali]
MPELSANARWLMDNLIDNDRQALVDIARRGEQYAAAGMPQDNRLGQVSRIVIDDAIRRHNQAWPDAAISFPGTDLAQASDEIGQRIRTQAARSWNTPDVMQTPAQWQPDHSMNAQAPAPEPRRNATSVGRPGGDTPAKPAVGENAREIWPRVNFPNSYVHLYRMTSKDGRMFDKMRVAIPQGTSIRGVDLTGWQLDRFLTDHARDAKLNGRDVTVSFKPGEPVELWRGKGEQRETMRIDDAWQLCRAVKAQRLAYARQRAENKPVTATPGTRTGEETPVEASGPETPEQTASQSRTIGKSRTLDAIKDRAERRTQTPSTTPARTRTQSQQSQTRSR